YHITPPLLSLLPYPTLFRASAIRYPLPTPIIRRPPVGPVLMKLIRNFSIIAHVDHGKSTLADRFIQICGGLQEREMEHQVLDSIDRKSTRLNSSHVKISYAV